jgi:hypothetical protein
MALYRWPTDPKGKAAAHTISWDAHQAHLKANANPAKPGEVKISTPNGFIPVSEWDFGYGKGVLQPDPTAPLAPGAPPPAGELPLPVDSTYDSDIAGYDRTRRDTKTGLVGERDRGLKEYGFTEDPTSKALAFRPEQSVLARVAAEEELRRLAREHRAEHGLARAALRRRLPDRAGLDQPGPARRARTRCRSRSARSWPATPAR